MVGLLVLLLFMLLIFANMPISISMGLATAVGLIILGVPGEVLPQKMITGTESWSLLAVPFYILAAQIMNHGDITERLFRFAEDVVGWIRGGLAHANVLASMIFAGISGAAVADAAGLGTIEIKVMTDAGYDKRFAVGITAASCMLGPIIPPSIMLILYGHLAELSIAALWFAGIVPGIMTGILLMAYIYFEVIRGKIDCPTPNKFNFLRFIRSFRANFFVIVLPLILLLCLLKGLATPTEVGIIACIYTFVLSLIFRGKAFIRDLPQVFINSARSTGILLFIVSTATAFVWILTTTKTAVFLSDIFLSITTNKYLLLLIINFLLLIIGALLEQIPALLIIVPLLDPIAAELGINRIQFGIVVVFNLMIGMITPPMGMALYIMGAITDVPMKDIIKYSMRFFFVLVIALLLITFIPALSTTLPKILGLRIY